MKDAAGNQLKEGSDFTLDLSEHNYAQVQVINSTLNGQILTINLLPTANAQNFIQ